ncbi:MAG TPA: pentapeptide repeat-containing protein [Kofleriaceae bacterium]|nr:pentapeptide repeat-containing protein [Kofleriaceae bacterium]
MAATSSSSSLAQRLRDRVGAPGARDFVGADLRETDLSGLSFDFLDLTNARLEGADLTDCRFSNVILTGARFAGATLRRSRFGLVEATQADFSGVDAAHSRWEHTKLLAARLDKANLTRTLLRGCTLDDASLVGADLSGGGIVYTSCCGTSFIDARLARFEALGSSFTDAVFTGARDFFSCREIVAEVLRRHAGNDIETSKLLGAVLVMPSWCYAEWKRYLADSEAGEHLQVALEAFGRYPASGSARALEEGWDWRRMSAEAESTDE